MFFSRRYSPPLGKGEGEKILFIRYSALGDILIATPFARALKERYPKSELIWLAACPYERILEGQPYIDGILPWDRRLDNKAFFQLLRRIRAMRFTRIVSLQGTDRGALMALFSGVPQRFCTAGKWEFLYNGGKSSSFWETYDIPVPEGPGSGFVTTEKMIKSASDILGEVKPPFLLAAIGASKEVKQWPARNWVEFCRKACDNGIPVVLAGDGAEELEKAEEICGSVSSDLLYDLVGRIPLSVLGGVVGTASLVLAGDTGILNMARIMGVPSMALLGPTPLPVGVGLMDPEQVFSADCSYLGCGKNHCRKACLESVEAENVFQAVATAWKSKFSQ